DRVRSSWRLRKSIPSSFREERDHEVRYLRERVLGSVKARFRAICRQPGSWPETGFGERPLVTSSSRTSGERGKFICHSSGSEIVDQNCSSLATPNIAWNRSQ